MGGTGLEPVTSCVSSSCLRIPNHPINNTLRYRRTSTCTHTCTESQKTSEKLYAHDTPELPKDLIGIVAIWPELPDHIKAAIKALVQTHEHETEKR
jgi:hypothetical protein